MKILRQGKQITEPADYAESRYLGYAPYDTGCYTLIYGDKVAIITINNYNETSGVILDDHNFANVQRLMFDTMWERL